MYLMHLQNLLYTLIEQSFFKIYFLIPGELKVQNADTVVLMYNTSDIRTPALVQK